MSKGVSAYLYLLCNAWLEDPPATLPNDDDLLASYARLSREEWDELKPELIHQFPLNSEGRLVNLRLLEEWNKQINRRSAGSKGGSKRVANHQAKGQANHQAALEDENEDENEREVEQEADPEKTSAQVEAQKALNSSNDTNLLHDLAAKIYAAYPRKVAKPDGIRAILKAFKRIKPDELLTRTADYAAVVATWPAGSHQFVPYPASWFNGDRFNDDPVTWKRDEVSKKSAPESNQRVEHLEAPRLKL